MNSIIKSVGAAFFFFMVFLCAQEKVSAATATIRFSGSISDSLSGEPVSGAVVAIPKLKLSVLSDRSGEFVMDSVPVSPDFLIVTAKGYAVRRIALTAAGFSASFQVKLSKIVAYNDAAPDTAFIDTNATITGKATADTGARESAQTAASQRRLIKGKVVDKKTGLPISNAIVSIAALNVALPSSPEGKFELNIPAAVTCTLTAIKSGYEQSSVLMDSGAKSDSIDISLAQSSVYQLQEMNISAGRIEVKQVVKTSEKISQVKMAPELIARLPNLGVGDLFRSLQLLPGVSATNEASSGLYVRGGTPDQNLIILNKMPIYYVDHFYGFFSAFNPDAISDITLHKGGFGSHFGGRVSSVVELLSGGKDVKSDSIGIRAGAGIGLLSGDAYLQVPIINKDVGLIQIAGRRAMTDIFKTDLFNRLFRRMHGNDTMNNQGGPVKIIGPIGMVPGGRIAYQPDFTFWDLNGLAAFKLGSRGKLATTFFGSLDNQDNSLDTAWSTKNINNYYRYTMDTTNGGKDPFTGGKPPYTIDTMFDTSSTRTTIKNKDPLSWGNICVGQEWEEKWSDAFKTRLNLSYSQFLDKKNQDDHRTDSIADRYSDTTTPHDTTLRQMQWMASKNKIIDLSGRFDNSLKFSDWNTLAVGVELSRKAVIYERDTMQPDTNSMEWQQWMKYMTPMAALQPVHNYDTSVSVAVYAEDEIKFGDKAGLTPGLRAYYFELAAASAIDPRVSGWYKVLPQLKVKGAWGIYTQEIHRVEEEDITGGGKFVWLLSKAHRPLEKSQHFIGGASWENPHFLLDAEGYLKRLSGLLTISERNRSVGMYYGKPFEPNQLALFEGTGFAKGVELLAQVKNVRFPFLSKTAIYDGWAAYTLSRVENTYDVFNSGNPFPATQDHTHEFKLVNNLEWNVAAWSSIDLSAVWIYSTGAPYTAPLGYYTLRMIDSTYDRSYLRVSDKNAYRLPDYHRLDLALGWKVRFGSHFESSLTLGLFNAYDHENILERTYTETTIGNPGMIPIKIRDPGAQSTAFTAVDKKAMSIMPNAAVGVSARF
jgi:ferric enterobactin receptor